MLRRGRNVNAVSMEEAEFIITFLNNVAAVHSLALPGRVPGKFLEKMSNAW